MIVLCLYFLSLFATHNTNYENRNNYAYSNESPAQILNITLSQTATNLKRQPAILILQDSSMTNKKINNLIWQNALKNGYAAIVITYRDTEKHPFPAQIQDVNAAIRWIKKFGHKFNIAPDKLFLFGAADGGYLAALQGITATYIAGVTAIIEFGSNTQIMQAQENEQKNQDYVELFNSNQTNSNTNVIGVIDFYGNLENSQKYYTPINYITPLSPPFIMVYKENNTSATKDYITTFYETLKNNICPNGTKNCYAKLIRVNNIGQEKNNSEQDNNPFYNQILIDKVFGYIAEILLEK